MPLSLLQTKTAVGPNTITSFQAIGGTPPYVYSVVPGGAGGTIDPDSGFYTAPASASFNLAKIYDTIQVTDAAPSTATARILVGTALELFREMIQQELVLDNDHCYFWNQKKMQPEDLSMYVIVAKSRMKIFGNNSRPGTTGWDQNEQDVHVRAELDVNVISRGLEAMFRIEEVVAVLNSMYSEAQQEGNSFYVAKISQPIADASAADGTAIPYRYVVPVVIQYTFSKKKAVEFFDQFRDVQVITDQVNPYVLDNDQQFVFDNGGNPLLKS